MAVPALAGETLALYNHMQEQIQGIVGTLNADIAALRNMITAAAVEADVTQRFVTADQGMSMLNQRLDTTSQAIEIRIETLTALMAAGGARGAARKVDITESKPANKLKDFGGGDREQFREWARQLMEVMQQLRPGARAVLR